MRQVTRNRRSRRRATVRAGLAGLLLAWGLQAAPGRAQGPAERDVALHDPAATAAWDGSFHDALAPSEPRAYGATGSCDHLGCDEVAVDVALPAGAWDGRPGGVQIAIDWPDEENDLDLYVYGPDGSLAGRSDGAIASTGESVRVHDAANG